MKRCSLVGLDRVLEDLGLRSLDALDLLIVLPEVKGRQRADPLAAHELVGRLAAVAHDLSQN